MQKLYRSLNHVFSNAFEAFFVCAQILCRPLAIYFWINSDGSVGGSNTAVAQNLMLYTGTLRGNEKIKIHDCTYTLLGEKPIV